MEIMTPRASKFSVLDDGHFITTEDDIVTSEMSVRILLDGGLANGVQKSEEHGQRVAILLCD